MTKNTLPARLSPAIAQQRSVMRCRAVPCLALRCGAVPCCAVLFFEHTVPGIMRNTRYQVRYARVYSSLRFFNLIVLSRSSSCVSVFRKLHPYRRSERNITNRHTAHHRAISSAQIALGIVKSLVAPNHGPLLSAPFTINSLRERSGRRQPPAERSLLTYLVRRSPSTAAPRTRRTCDILPIFTHHRRRLRVTAVTAETNCAVFLTTNSWSGK